MAEKFLALGREDQREALLVAADRTGRPSYLLEKDVWVVWTLNALFETPLGEHLVFKGGTSLSKAYDGLIARFSEDIDLTHDIRQLIPDLAGDAEEPIPPSKSQSRKWTAAVRESLPAWISDHVAPALRAAVDTLDLKAEIIQDEDKLRLIYQTAADGYGYVNPEVLLEFGARSTGEPAKRISVACDAAAVLGELEFPVAEPRVMAAERTFWEKATAAHVYCLRESFRGDRFARHWHDLMKLAEAGIAASAISDKRLAMRVAEHKQAFFAEKTEAGEEIDYRRAISGALQLVPRGKALEELERDYLAMIESKLLEGDPISFAALMEQCQAIEDLANAAGKNA
jgi:hypothetical protein